MPLKNKLSRQDLDLVKIFSQSCRHSILQMVVNAQSGHPGGSLGLIDYLSLLCPQIIARTGEPVIVSNGHVSPAVYAVLAEMGYINQKQALEGFRKIGRIYEGHVTRQVPGVWYGTGPLGCGISAAAGFALAEKLKTSSAPRRVFATIGDGESQEGQVYEMMNFAAKYKLDNFIVFLDYNLVQLSDGLNKIMPVNIRGHFAASGWEGPEAEGNNYRDLWQALRRAYKTKDRPILLLGRTIMGKGVDFMEEAGKKYEATWHGKAPSPEQARDALNKLMINNKQSARLEEFRKNVNWKPIKPSFLKPLSMTKLKTGAPRLYASEEKTDCRRAYCAAPLDLAKLNKNIVALTADQSDSVKTSGVKNALPERHIECGVAEQQMVSCSGGMSLNGYVPFCSTFGVFMTSRAKDQARVNDINRTNVKMVATHCGLSVGEDGPTHQVIDDMGSMAGFLNTQVLEPADANQTDHIIRFIAGHYGNFYVRMGRHKVPVLTTEEGEPFFGQDYKYDYGKCDILREGTKLTLVASGSMVSEALKARELLQADGKKHLVEIIIASSIKKFDDTLIDSIKKTGRVVTVEDHNLYSGLGTMVRRLIVDKQLSSNFL